MTTFTLYEYKADSLYRSVADNCLFTQVFDSLADACSLLVSKYPTAQLVETGKAGKHYLSIVQNDNEFTHTCLGFYSI